MLPVGLTVASEHLPDDEEQDWVVDQLGVLVSRCGRDRLLEAPLLEPSPAYFPDPWSPDILGAAGILRRLMDYAGLGDLGVDASVLGPSDAEFLDRDGFRAAACFFGIRDGKCSFGVHPDDLGDAEHLAGVLAHEVAHAFRERHVLIDPHPETEERLTDLTTIYLGFGLLCANSALRAEVADDGVYRTRGGYLSVETMAFALAAHAVARRASPDTKRRVMRLLGADQASVFRYACEELEADDEGLAADLGLDALPPALPRDPARILGRRPVAAAEPGVWQGSWWGRFTHRVIGRRTRAGMAVGSVVGLAVGFLVAHGRVVPPAAGAALWLGSFFGGWLLGYGARSDRCSACGARLPVVCAECPRCLSAIMGVLAQPPDRLATGESRGRPVFRVRDTRVGQTTMRGVVVGLNLAAAALLSLSFRAGGLVGLALVLPPLVGWLLGRRQRRDICSGVGCGTELPAFLRECPRCLGQIRREISSETGHFGALEQLEDEHAAMMAELQRLEAEHADLPEPPSQLVEPAPGPGACAADGAMPGQTPG